ncbi:MAG: hypothetical protein HOQ07_12025, partial [Sinomonas sp.]|nr:hypothetical protein [Sinomonas sp.]
MADPVRHPLAVAVNVEARKLVDTRSARWLLVVMLLIGLMLIGLAVGVAHERGAALEVSTIIAGLALPGALVSPFLAILSITADWQHKDVVKFYALQPRRLVILAAKYVAVTGFSFLVVGTACLCGLLVA